MHGYRFFTWLQCFSMYVSIRASHTSSIPPELMAYMSHIIRVHQDYTGLACMDTAFCCQAALTAKWSAINPTLYSICFTGVAQATTRCEICLATSHSMKDCAKQGNPDPGVLDWVKALESMVLSVSPRASLSATPLENCQQMEICHLWNRNRCSFRRYRYCHVCLSCKGDHPAIACPTHDKHPLPAKQLPATAGGR